MLRRALAEREAVDAARPPMVRLCSSTVPVRQVAAADLDQLAALLRSAPSPRARLVLFREPDPSAPNRPATAATYDVDAPALADALAAAGIAEVQRTVSELRRDRDEALRAYEAVVHDAARTEADLVVARRDRDEARADRDRYHPPHAPPTSLPTPPPAPSPTPPAPPAPSQPSQPSQPSPHSVLAAVRDRLRARVAADRALRAKLTAMRDDWVQGQAPPIGYPPADAPLSGRSDDWLDGYAAASVRHAVDLYDLLSATAQTSASPTPPAAPVRS